MDRAEIIRRLSSIAGTIRTQPGFLARESAEVLDAAAALLREPPAPHDDAPLEPQIVGTVTAKLGPITPLEFTDAAAQGPSLAEMRAIAVRLAWDLRQYEQFGHPITKAILADMRAKGILVDDDKAKEGAT